MCWQSGAAGWPTHHQGFCGFSTNRAERRCCCQKAEWWSSRSSPACHHEAIRNLPHQIPKSANATFAHVGGAYLEKLASLAWPTYLVPFTRVRVAALMAQYMAPVDKIVDSKCQLLKESDLAKLVNKNNLKQVELAEEMLEGARELCDVHSVDRPTKISLLCWHDCRIIYHLLNKGKASKDGKNYDLSAGSHMTNAEEQKAFMKF